MKKKIVLDRPRLSRRACDRSRAWGDQIFSGAEGHRRNTRAFPRRPRSVTSLIAKEEDWVPLSRAVGSTAAVQGVTVSTDEPGIVQKINFESGQTVKEGDLLVQLEVSQEQAQLRSAEAQMRLAGANLLRQQNLLKSRVSSQADYDTAQAAVRPSRGQESRRSRPSSTRRRFALRSRGVLGIRAVNLGQYLQSGAQVAPLQSLDPIYVNFWLPQQNLGQIAAGQPVQVRADGLPNVHFEGKINAVDAVIDEATRNVRVQATLPNSERPSSARDVRKHRSAAGQQVESHCSSCNRDPIRAVWGYGLYHRGDEGPRWKDVPGSAPAGWSRLASRGRPRRHPFGSQCRRGSRDFRRLQAASRRPRFKSITAFSRKTANRRNRRTPECSATFPTAGKS